jgi:PAS domain-containing protein
MIATGCWQGGCVIQGFEPIAASPGERGCSVDDATALNSAIDARATLRYRAAELARCARTEGGRGIWRCARLDANRRMERRRNAHPGTTDDYPETVTCFGCAGTDPVVAVVLDGTILFANTPFAEMVGCAPEGVLSLKFDEIFQGTRQGTRSVCRPCAREHGRRTGAPGRLDRPGANEQVGANA